MHISANQTVGDGDEFALDQGGAEAAQDIETEVILGRESRRPVSAPLWLAPDPRTQAFDVRLSAGE
jgi:hypothetical protein